MEEGPCCLFQCFSIIAEHHCGEPGGILKQSFQQRVSPWTRSPRVASSRSSDIIIVLPACQWLWKAWTATDQHWPLNGWEQRGRTHMQTHRVSNVFTYLHGEDVKVWSWTDLSFDNHHCYRYYCCFDIFRCLICAYFTKNSSDDGWGDAESENVKSLVNETPTRSVGHVGRSSKHRSFYQLHSDKHLCLESMS